ncbi:DUF805 domain-containing protein [Erythrobacter sp. GH1-10]|uniref:DUF805 domain-containing protein n=1 Tax=Erythrobacter sp. GH1-10 TaxID=3349334 RepID=UPI003877BCB8
MINSVRYNLSSLTDFSGRDARQTFWFYILFVFVVQYAIGIAVALPMIVGIFTTTFDAVSSGADPDTLSAEMLEGMTGYLELQMWVSAIVSLVAVLLVVAAFVRRLHDAGFSGWIAAIPVATQIFSVGYSIVMFDEIMAIAAESMNPANPANPAAMQIEAHPLSLVGWVGYLVVIGFGILKSQHGPNRYGGEPVHH